MVLGRRAPNPHVETMLCRPSAAEGAKFAATMNEFVEAVTKLGENKRLEDLRCKK